MAGIINNARKAVLVTQLIVAVVLIISSVINLALLPQQRDLWLAILSACLGFLTPAPYEKRAEEE